MKLVILLAVLFLAACGGPGAPYQPQDYLTAEMYQSNTEEADEEAPSQPAPFVPPPAPTAQPRALAAPRRESQRDYSADALWLVEMAEAVHPIFILEGMLCDNYEAIRDAFLQIASEPITRTDFMLAAQRYLVVLQDAHTVVFANNHTMPTRRFIQQAFTERDSRLFLRDSETEVLAVGGVLVPEIFAQIDRHYFAENEAGRMRNYARYVRYEPMLRLAGAEIFMDQGWLIYITTYADGAISDMPVRFGDPPWPPPPRFDIDHAMIDDVFFIDLRRFVDGAHIDRTVEAIEAAITDGIREFIIDVRGNGGGNSWVGTRLLGAMGITTPLAGAIIRISDPLREAGIVDSQFPDIAPDTYRIDYLPNLETAANPNDVFVSVLTDNETFSSAMWMAMWVADGGFGNVVG